MFQISRDWKLETVSGTSSVRWTRSMQTGQRQIVPQRMVTGRQQGRTGQSFITLEQLEWRKLWFTIMGELHVDSAQIGLCMNIGLLMKNWRRLEFRKWVYYAVKLLNIDGILFFFMTSQLLLTLNFLLFGCLSDCLGPEGFIRAVQDFSEEWSRPKERGAIWCSVHWGGVGGWWWWCGSVSWSGGNGGCWWWICGGRWLGSGSVFLCYFLQQFGVHSVTVKSHSYRRY